jgi:hypothetical protein
VHHDPGIGERARHTRHLFDSDAFLHDFQQAIGRDLERRSTRWVGQDVVIFDELVEVYGAAVQAWAGVGSGSPRRISRQLAAIVDGFGGAGTTLGQGEVTDTWPLIRFLPDKPSYRARYNHYVAQAVESEYTPEAYITRFREARDLIAPFVTGEDGEQASYTFVQSPEAFTQAVEQLEAHVTARRDEVQAYLATEQ